MSISLDNLYAYYDIINDTTNDEDKRLEAYKSILKALDGDEKCQRLASQFIAKFFKSFPEQQKEAFSKYLDIFEKSNVDARKQAVHDLRFIGRHSKDYIPRITGVYSQLIQTDDQPEYSIASQALGEFILCEPKAVLEVILSQMVDDGSENSRVGIFKFLQENLKKIPENQLNEELETFIMNNLQKVLEDVSEIEFIPLISVMSSLKSMSTVVGRQKLVDMITHQAIEDVPEFQIDDISAVAQIRESAKQISCYISKNVHAKEMLEYLMNKVLPQLVDSSKSIDNEDLLCLWQVIAALSNHGGSKWTPTDSDVNQYLESMFSYLDKILPSTEEVSDSVKKPKLEIDYTLMECILFTLLSVGKHHPESSIFRSDNWSQTKVKLQVLARTAQDYQYTIRVNDNEKVDPKMKVLIQKTMKNILDMVKAFFKNPISFSLSDDLVLSWRQPTETKTVTTPSRKADDRNKNQFQNKKGSGRFQNNNKRRY